MRQITSLLVLLGITLLVYGLYNCSCRKMSIEKFQETPNINNQTQQINGDLSKMTSIAENNKYLLEKTNEIRGNIQKMMMLKK